VRKILPWTIVAVIVAAGAVSCLPPPVVEPTPIEFTTIAKGYYSAVEVPSNEVISDVDTWEDIWDSLVAHFLEPEPAPEVNFEEYILLAHFMGERETSGYEVEFIEVLEGDEISATVREVSPGPECILPQVITAPYHVIQIPKTDKQVKFTIEEILGPYWYDWPMFHRDPQRTGKAETAAHGIITDSDGFQWPYPVSGIVGSPVVDEYGTIYFGSADGKLYALYPSGTLKFSTQLTRTNIKISSSPGLSASYSIYPRRVYIGTHEVAGSQGDNFFAVRADEDGSHAAGTVIWSLDVPDEYNASAIMGLSSPLVVTDPINGEPVIYVGAADGFLYCIRDHGDEGEVVWSKKLQDAAPLDGFRSSAAMGPPPAGQLGTLGTIYCGGKEKLFALDPYDGEIIDAKTIRLVTGTAPSQEWVSSPSVTIVDGVETIFAGTSDRQMRAVAIEAGIAKLAADNYGVGAIITACPAIYDLNGDGKVEAIFGDGAGVVHAITYDPINLGMPSRWDRNSPGSWTYPTPTGSQAIISSAAVALAPQPTVFVGVSFFPMGGKIYSINGGDGTPSGSYTMAEPYVFSSPAIAQEGTDLYGAPGWVFIGSVDNPAYPSAGKLYAFGPEFPAIETERWGFKS